MMPAMPQAAETDSAPFPPAARASSRRFGPMRVFLSGRLTSIVAAIAMDAHFCMVYMFVDTIQMSSTSGSSR